MDSRLSIFLTIFLWINAGNDMINLKRRIFVSLICMRDTSHLIDFKLITLCLFRVLSLFCGQFNDRLGSVAFYLNYNHRSDQDKVDTAKSLFGGRVWKRRYSVEGSRKAHFRVHSIATDEKITVARFLK